MEKTIEGGEKASVGTDCGGGFDATAHDEERWPFQDKCIQMQVYPDKYWRDE